MASSTAAGASTGAGASAGVVAAAALSPRRSDGDGAVEWNEQRGVKRLEVQLPGTMTTDVERALNRLTARLDARKTDSSR